MFMNRPELDGPPGAMVAALQLAAVGDAGDLLLTLYPNLEELLTKLEHVYGLRPDQWKDLNLEERTNVLQKAHNAVAATYGFKPSPVTVTRLSPKYNGFFNHETERIEINTRLVTGNDNIQPLRTLFHESRHAYQWHFAQPVRQGFGWLSDGEWTLAQEWSDNFDDYKPADQNSFKEYYDQPIEVDARKFAETVTKLLFGK
jgi:hypothetical protein